MKLALKEVREESKNMHGKIAVNHKKLCMCTKKIHP